MQLNGFQADVICGPMLELFKKKEFTASNRINKPVVEGYRIAYKLVETN